MRALLGIVGRAAAGVLLVSATGCAAQLGGQKQLAVELLEAKDEAAAQRARVAELETRLIAIEKEQASSKRGQATRDAPVLAKLDRLIRVNEQLLQRTPASPASPASASQSASMSMSMSSSARSEPSLSSSTLSPAAADPSCGEGIPPEEQLERLVRRIHGHASGWRGGLSVEQRQALRILQRRERELDARSPWQAW